MVGKNGFLLGCITLLSPALVNLAVNVKIRRKTPSSVLKREKIHKALSQTSTEERSWIREFFIHEREGFGPLWLPESSSSVLSLLKSGIIENLGNTKVPSSFGYLSLFKLNRVARQRMVGRSNSNYSFPRELAGNRNSRDLSLWSDVTFFSIARSGMWFSGSNQDHLDPGYRNRLMIVNHLFVEYADPKLWGVWGSIIDKSRHPRPDFFWSPECIKKNQKNPALLAYQIGDYYRKKNKNSSPYGVLPKKNSDSAYDF